MRKERENYSEASDAQLIAAYRSGKIKAFDVLVQRYKTQLFTYLLKMIGDRETAEDLFQEVFLKVLRGLDHYREKNRFRQWLFTIAHRLILDEEKKNHHPGQSFQYLQNHELERIGRNDHSGPGYQEENAVETEELRRILEQAVQQLPELQRQVFLLRLHGELTFQEIAALLDRPLGTVLAQMHYALEKLRKIIHKEYQGGIHHVLSSL